MGHSYWKNPFWQQRLMGWCYWLCLLILIFRTSVILAETAPNEAAALNGLAGSWHNPPRNWVGSDPCGSVWDGITCKKSHIIYIELASRNLNGTLSGDIQGLSELEYLDLSYNQDLGGPIPPSIGNLVKLRYLVLVGCSFTSTIPEELGNLPRLFFLSINSNKLHGTIPGALGSLSKLYWFDITDNEISGPIPVSNGNNPGLDMLTQCRHFHFGMNKLSGPIPAKLFHQEMNLIHVLFDSNNLSGSIPSTLGLVKTLEAIRLDVNLLSGPVPSNLNNLTNVQELHLSSNQLTGPLPNLTGMNLLAFVDMSNNSFDESSVPSWFSTLPSLTTLMLEYSSVGGQIPPALFDNSPLQTARLRNNRFNGTLDLGTGYSSALSLVDLQNNNIQQLNTRGFSHGLLLAHNPICNQGVSSVSQYCSVPDQSNSSTYSDPTPSCGNILCQSDQEMSPQCHCSYPYEGTIYFRLFTFSDIGNPEHYQALEGTFRDQLQEIQVPVSSVSVQIAHINNIDHYLQMKLLFYPAGEIRFGANEVSRMASFLSNVSLNGSAGFGPYYFIPLPYAPSQVSEAAAGSKSNKKPVIIGATVGGVVLVSVMILLIVFALRRKNVVKKALSPSLSGKGSGNPTGGSSSIPQVKGPRWFSFEEAKKCTNYFSEENDIGSGGYGKVYRGILPDGQLVAIKRAQQGSLQGDPEFKTEIETLSRVHHKNLVSLVGFCFDQGEQMLVYEYVPNGTLKESLSGKSGVRLDWKRRLRVALDAARGLTYLHEMANPPIVHRDIKPNNILLDHLLNAKVSDFGLSKPLGDKKGYITTQVKGTMGYLDPEYYMTQQLTEKSDVYSFGVLLLELVTARKPIDRGRYVVREVRNSIDGSKDLYGLNELLDPNIGLGTQLPGFEKFIDLAMKCVAETGLERPSMGEVVKEIENIMQLAGMNPNLGSGSTSSGFGVGNRSHPYSGDASFDYSGGPYTPKVEPM